MIRRILTASILSVATAISGLGVVAQAATAPAATTTVSGVTQTVRTATRTQATPTLDCGAGIVGTVCAIVLGPICRDRCGADGAAQASTAISGTANTARATSAAGTATASSPKLFCEPAFEVICEVLGLTVCRRTGCPTAPAPQLAVSSAVQPSIDCDIDVVCLVLALTVCRRGCAVSTSAAPATTAQPRSVQTCTVDLRPNVYCLLQQV